MHIAEDHFFCEVVDKNTLQPVPDGQPGELVITSLSKEALPILRYRTKDITWLIPEKCECGRTSMRMAKVQGRTDDMLIIRGVNVFPSQIESVLLGVEDIGPHYEIIVRKDGYMDKIEVLVEVIDASLLDKFSALGGAGAQDPACALHRAQYRSGGEAGGARIAQALRGQSPARHRPAQPENE